MTVHEFEIIDTNKIEVGSLVDWVKPNEIKESDVKHLMGLVRNIGRGPFHVLSVEKGEDLTRVKILTMRNEVKTINSIFLKTCD